MLAGYLPQERRFRGQHRIGCILLAEPVFFAEDEWVVEPADWQANIVRGKGYELTEGEGARIWRECLDRATARRVQDLALQIAEARPRRYGNSVLVHPRLGQGSFRVSVLDAYQRACAVTREHSLPVLKAAHIRPFSEGGPHDVSNGLLLRSDIHRLFDAGYVTVTPEYRFEVSRRLKEEFENGRSYYPLHGQRILLPRKIAERPDSALLRWHNEDRFLK